MPAEVSHEEWVRRSRHQKKIIDRQRNELLDLRADLAAVQRRLNRVLNYRTTAQKDDNA